MPNCYDAYLSWRKSSFSGNGDCVEVASGKGFIAVRDSKQRDSHILEFTRLQWHDFVVSIRSGSIGARYPQKQAGHPQRP
jgi:Domain of unknown function (DUF397)